MKMLCSACERPLGPWLRQCPYCGSPIGEPGWYRGARPALTGLIILSLTWAVSRQPLIAISLHERLRAVLHHPPSALLLAMALTLACLPLVRPACRPGAPSADMRRQTLLANGRILFFGLALAACAVLLSHSRQTAVGALPALAALLAYPRLMLVPVYPLLAVPVIALAWSLGAT